MSSIAKPLQRVNITSFASLIEEDVDIVDQRGFKA